MTTPLIFTDPSSMQAGPEERAFIHLVWSQDDRPGMVGTNSSRSEVRGQNRTSRAKTNKALDAMWGPAGGGWPPCLGMG